MAHVRTQIREALKVLLTGLATTGNNVFTNRLQVLKDASLPAIEIETGDEDITIEDGVENPVLERVMRVDVLVKVKAVEGLDDLTDQILSEVETAISVDVDANTLSGLVKSIDLSEINLEQNDDAEKDIAELRIGFDVQYFTQANAPEIAI